MTAFSNNPIVTPQNSVDLTLPELLAHLRTLDVRISLDAGKLAVSAPKDALTDDLKTALRTRKAELLQFLSKVQAIEPATAKTVTGDSTHATSLSFAQQRLWFLDRIAPGNPIYNEPCEFRLSGPLDVDALEKSLQTVVERHDILRTVYRETDGSPTSFVQNIDVWNLNVVYPQPGSIEDREAEVLRLSREEAQRPFDLSNGPMFRATLYIITETEAVLCTVAHHISTDGWSFGVLMDELSTLYSAFSTKQPSPLPPLPLQYADYAAWHRDWLAGGILAEQLPYWQKQLAAPLPVLDLPTDRPRPAVQTHYGHELKLVLTPEMTTQLEQFSAHEKVSLFMTLLAGYQVVLARHTGQYDVVVGTAVANRNRAEFEKLIGFFVSNLALRTNLSGDPTVREALRRVRAVALDGFAHSEVPFDRVVEVLHPERNLGRSPIFQTMFVLQHWPQTDVAANNLHIRRIESDTGIARYDISVDALKKDGSLTFYFSFNSDLFDIDTVGKITQHYRMILSEMIRHPDRSINALNMLTPAETEELTVTWNNTSIPFPDSIGVHDLIDKQASETPDAIAVRCGTTTLTYRQLVQRANQLAHKLRALGAGPDKLVGVSVDRSEAMLVAALGIWKAGGGYVPLDPAYPAERLSFMAEDAGLTAHVTEERHISTVPGIQCPVVCIDSDIESISREPVTAPQFETSSNQIAYVIYTSGSTGKPKGVLVEHRSVVNFLTAMQRSPGLTANDTLFSVTTLSFDIAGLELYLPLIAGGTIVLATREMTVDGMVLAKAIIDAKTTIMQATPATWRLLFEAGWNHGKNLKILCGGEALSRNLADKILATGAELWNMYGPTETTIWSTTHQVSNGEDPVPIGRPIANTTLFILDEKRQLVPANVPGELYIGGDGLARGYHNRPDLTAERFIPDPFSNRPGARLYRTGDQVRYRSDGTLEYLNRLDNQVKVRGFRIELGEIESVLETHDDVHHAVVLAREDSPGDQRLVAYLIQEPNATIKSNALRIWMSERVPPYLVPSTFVFLESFPLTPNGKVDRRALPAPQITSAAESFIAPMSGIESDVAALWKEVLRVDRVGTNDNFFDLGGHSLLVVQLQSKIRERFKCDLPLMELFRRPTVGAITQYLHEIAEGMSTSPMLTPKSAAPTTSLTDRARERAQRQNRAARRD